MRKTMLLVGLILSATTVFSQKQEATMPRFNSDAEKAAWIANHPEDYERMTGEKVTNVIPEFKTKEEKQAWIDQHKGVEKPALATGSKVEIKSEFSSDAEKAAWIEANPEEYARRTGNQSNVVAPEFKSEQEKAEWEAKQKNVSIPVFQSEEEKAAWWEKYLSNNR